LYQIGLSQAGGLADDDVVVLAESTSSTLAGTRSWVFFRRPLEKTPVRGDAHDGLGDTERDDLGVGRMPADVGLCFWQEIIGCAINEGAVSVEVGVHRALLADGDGGTVCFGLSASNPFFSAMFVESLIDSGIRRWYSASVAKLPGAHSSDEEP
jgi:hypothetical protein